MSRVTPDEVRQLFQQVADQLERGGVESVTIKVMTDDGEVEHTFNAKTEEDRLAALLAIREALGQLH